MKNIKKTKILVPALALTMLTTVASVTSTVAWFVSNNTATATGMGIKATSNSAYLLITKTTETDGKPKFDGGTHDINLMNDSETAPELLPAAIDEDNYKDADKPASWYYCVGTAFENGSATTDEGGAAKKTSLTDFKGYVFNKTAYLRLAANSADGGAITLSVGKTFDVKQNGNANQDFLNAASILVKTTVAGGTSKATVDDPFKLTGAIGGHADHQIISAMASGVVLKVDFYFYYDGNNNYINTSNFSSFKDKWLANANFTFNMAPVTHA